MRRRWSLAAVAAVIVFGVLGHLAFGGTLGVIVPVPVKSSIEMKAHFPTSGEYVGESNFSKIVKLAGNWAVKVRSITNPTCAGSEIDFAIDKGKGFVPKIGIGCNSAGEAQFFGWSLAKIFDVKLKPYLVSSLGKGFIGCTNIGAQLALHRLASDKIEAYILM